MGRSFFRLAISNIRRNKRLVIPFYCLCNYGKHIFYGCCPYVYRRHCQYSAGKSVSDVFNLGCIIMSLIVAIFMFYINSF